MSASSSKTRWWRSGCRRKGRPAGAGGRKLGELEEYFIEQLVAGRHLRLRRRCAALRGPARGRAPMSPAPTTRKRKSPATMAASFRSRPSWPSACARWCRSRKAGTHLPEPVQEWLQIQEWRSVIPEAGPVAGRDFSARQPPVSGLLSVRGPAGAPDPGHAADAPAGAAARCGRWALSPTNMRWRSGRRATWAASTWTRCSTRTCWATIWTPGWRNPISTSAPSATAPSSPA